MSDEVKKANRLVSTKLAKKMVDEYWNFIRTAKEEGKLVCLLTGAAINPFFMVMDIAWLQGNGYASRTAGRHEERVPQQASEARGYVRELCSYARTHIGCSLFTERGVPEGVEAGEIASGMPKPDMMVSFYPSCTSALHWQQSVYRLFGKKIPSFNIIVPFRWGKNGGYMHGQEYQECVAFVVKQLREFVRFLEDVTGRRFDWDRLSELMLYVKQAAILRLEAMALCKAKPAPANFFDWSISLGPVNYLTGWPGTREFYEQLKADVEGRIARGESSVPNEKYRLFWQGIMNWNKIGWLADKFANFDACIVAGAYTHFAFWHEPWAIDPENPLEGIAINFVEHELNQGVPLFADRIVEACREYSVDGLVVHGPRTCKPWTNPQFLLVDDVTKRLGIPAAVFEGDMVDTVYYQDGLIDTKVEAMLEAIAAKRAQIA